MESSYNQIMDNILSKIADIAYIGLLIILIPIAIISVSRLGVIGLSPIIIMTFVLLLPVLLGFIFKHKLSYKKRIMILIFCGVVISFTDFYALGMLSMGVVSLMATTILLTIFFHVRSFLYFFLGATIFLMAITYCAINGIFEFGFSVEAYFYSAEAWYTQISTYILVTVVLGFTIIRLKDFLSDYINNLFKLNNELHEAHQQISTAEEEIRSQYQTTVNREEMIRYIAFHDNLTELPNRTAFINKIREVIADVEGDQKRFAIILMDLDDFKKTNDLLGHDFGDDVLMALSKKLERVMRDAIMTARLSGDEFGFLIEYDDIKEVYESCEAILKDLEEPIIIEEVYQYLKTSMGVAVYPKDGLNYHQLLQYADTAMTEVKYSGKHNYKFFTSHMKSTITRRLEMENQLKLVYESDEIFPVFQPKVNAITEEIVGVEALARWFSPKFGNVSPVEFIPLMEECGIMIEFGLVILEKSLRQLKRWHNLGYEHLTLAVNVSAVQFKQSDFPDKVKELLSAYEINSEQLELEVTESTFIDDMDTVVAMLQELRDMGIKISLDDFGTGFSSLTYLRKLPITTLKIDKSFVDAVQRDNDLIMIPTIINMAHGLEFDVVAEGIEELTQVDVLKTYYCDYLQGYYFCKPTCADEITNKYFS